MSLLHPVVLSEAAWHQARQAPDVIRWRNDAAGESFAIPLSGTTALFHVRVNNQHLQFEGPVDLNHAGCCRAVGPFVAENPRR